MAGSFGHVVNDKLEYRGCELIENLGDAEGAIEEMAFLLLYFAEGNTDEINMILEEHYYPMARGEKPPPHWWTTE
jgi:hypothetical protein